MVDDRSLADAADAASRAVNPFGSYAAYALTVDGCGHDAGGRRRTRMVLLTASALMAASILSSPAHALVVALF